ncbi:MAG: hypothetical protein VCC04_11870, partial [Myxococcota bacterium]
QKQVSYFTLHFGAPRAAGEPALAPDPSAPRPSLPTLIGQEIPGIARHLYRIDVTVSWSEGFEIPEKVYRTTYLFDLAKAAEIYQSEEDEDEDADDDLEEDEEGDLGLDEDSIEEDEE